jgi:hypothetical protein
MKMKCTLLPAAIGAALILNSTSGNASAAYCSGFSNYAHRINDIAQELSHEFSVHYRHLDDYIHLRSDISRIVSEARHIDRLSHNGYSSLCHISTDLEDLDRLAHHMHGIVDRAERSHWRGHAHGNTRHVHHLLNALNGSIHSMQRLAEELNHRDSHYREPRVIHCEPAVIQRQPRVIHYRNRHHSSLSLATGLLRIAFSAHH